MSRSGHTLRWIGHTLRWIGRAGRRGPARAGCERAAGRGARAVHRHTPDRAPASRAGEAEEPGRAASVRLVVVAEALAEPNLLVAHLGGQCGEQAGPGEHRLRERFGDDYEAYRRHTPRFFGLPRLTGGGGRRTWACGVGTPRSRRRSARGAEPPRGAPWWSVRRAGRPRRASAPAGAAAPPSRHRPRGAPRRSGCGCTRTVRR